jgi:plastocyanin
MSTSPKITAAGYALVLTVVAGCGGGERAAPEPAELTIAKTETESGDKQVGVAGAALALDLRVVVTRDGAPAEGVPVVWRTPEGSVTAVPATGPDGISTARWTLRRLFGQQVAFASLEADGPPDVVFTAISGPDPTARNTVLVGAEGNQFSPAELTIEVGDTVNWLWPPGSEGHNVVPDDADSPPPSGAPAGYPKFHSFRFELPGIYHYHCTVHGAADGVGMSGTVTVVPPCVTPCER